MSLFLTNQNYDRKDLYYNNDIKPNYELFKNKAVIDYANLRINIINTQICVILINLLYGGVQ